MNSEIKHINWSPEHSDKNGYDHYMLKEIHEQPDVIRRILSKYITELQDIYFKNISNIQIKDVNRFIIQACGTSWHSGLIAKYYIEHFAKILTDVDMSSEFRYRRMLGKKNDVVLAISQSGETADTLAGIRQAKANFFNILSFVNVKNSTIDRESDGVIYSYSGQEIGVASTKNFLAQVISLFLFSLYIAKQNKEIKDEDFNLLICELQKLPGYIESLLSQASYFESLADKYYLSNQFLFVGRGVNYPAALEGALKLKEISYIHATGMLLVN